MDGSASGSLMRLQSRGWLEIQSPKSLPGDFPGGAVVKNPPAKAGDTVRALVREDPTCRGATKPVSHNY